MQSFCCNRSHDHRAKNFRQRQCKARMGEILCPKKSKLLSKITPHCVLEKSSLDLTGYTRSSTLRMAQSSKPRPIWQQKFSHCKETFAAAVHNWPLQPTRRHQQCFPSWGPRRSGLYAHTPWIFPRKENRVCWLKKLTMWV